MGKSLKYTWIWIKTALYIYENTRVKEEIFFFSKEQVVRVLQMIHNESCPYKLLNMRLCSSPRRTTLFHCNVITVDDIFSRSRASILIKHKA